MKQNDMTYSRRVHRFGRVWFFAAYFLIYLFPVVTCIWFRAWPTFRQLFTAVVGVIPIYWAGTAVEVVTFVPMLGAGGSYLGFITGNMANMKVPAAINAMEAMGVRPGTEEGDVISTIVIAVSSIVSSIVILLFVVLMVPLSALFAAPVLSAAFENAVPALFGALTVVFVSKCRKIGIPPLIFCVLLFLLVPSLTEFYPLMTPVVAGATIWLARVMYNKGILHGKE